MVLLGALGALVVTPAKADLTAVVTPGYQFPLDGSVPPSFDLLNLLALPTISIYGTVGGSNTLAVGSVTGTQLSSSVADGITIGFNGNTPPSLQFLAAGAVGPGLTNTGTGTLGVQINGSLAFQSNTNPAGKTNFSLSINTNWTFNQVWTPWTIYSLPTNNWATNSMGVWTNPANAWGYTNIVPITNVIVSGNPAPTVSTNDVIPIISTLQQTNPTTISPLALAQALNAFYPKQIATISFSAPITTNGVGNGTNSLLVNSNDSVTAIALTDNNGSYNVMNPAVPVAATGTNLYLTNLVAQLAAAINGFPNTPQWTATASGTNLYLSEPQAFFANSGNQVTVTLALNTGAGTTKTNLTATVRNTWFNPTNWYGGLQVVSNTPSSPGPIKLWANTNYFTMNVLFQGTWSISGDTWAVYLADSATNQVFLLSSNGNSGATITSQIFRLPAQYGIYAKRTAGSGGQPFSSTFNVSATPTYP